MKQFILSLVMPTKMVRHRNMSLLFTVLIFLSAMILMTGISGLTLGNYIQRKASNFLLYEEMFLSNSDEFATLPTFSIVESNYSIDTTTYLPGSNAKDIYEFNYPLADGHNMNLTIVYEPDVRAFDDESTPEVEKTTLDFDFRSYYNHKVATDENGKPLDKDILVVVTSQMVYYLYNHGKAFDTNSGKYTEYLLNAYFSIYETNEDGSIKYYLPTAEEEDLTNQYGDWDINSWTETVDEEDKLLTAESTNGIYKAQPKLYDNIFKIFSNDDSTRRLMGAYSLLEISNMGYNLGALNTENGQANGTVLLEMFGNIITTSFAEQFKLTTFLIGFIFVVLFPVLWTAAIWLVSRKNAELTRFKEYYNIAAITMIPIAIIMCIVVIFFPYLIVYRYALIAHVAWFAYAAVKINSHARKENFMRANNQKSNDSQNNHTRENARVYEVETVPLKDENNSKPGQIE